MSKINFYTIFHLNIAFSSIAEKDYPTVIKSCYWPLLRLAQNYPIGIEATGYTLEVVSKIDPEWISTLRQLIKQGKCEFIGSGYAQIIGPLVPYEVNVHNLNIGKETYNSLLEVNPRIAFVNEQAYSSGLVSIYKDAGYEAIIMDWNNPADVHMGEWNKDWQYFPQYAVDDKKRKIPVIWNNHIAFQKFQRYIHGEYMLDYYLEYLKSHIGTSKGARFFPLYGSDAEVFDYRPGRFHTESAFRDKREWAKISNLFAAVSDMPEFNIVKPSAALDYMKAEVQKRGQKVQLLTLNTPDKPISVKKQPKYNIARWALTGRDSLRINTQCYKIYDNIKNLKETQEVQKIWKQLCFLWDSDFRTHIEQNKFKKFQSEIRKVLDRSSMLRLDDQKVLGQPLLDRQNKKAPIRGTYTYSNGYVFVDTPKVSIKLNAKRGLAIDSLIYKNVSNKPLIGSIDHGYYDAVSYSVDFYTGHLSIETPGSSKITDLGAVEPHFLDEGGSIVVSGTIQNKFGTIKKTLRIYKDEERVDIIYGLNISIAWPSVFRLGYVKIKPEAFDKNKLFYSCHNGGKEKELFKLDRTTSINTDPFSLLVTTRSALGNTTGQLEIGDNKKKILIITDMTKHAALPMVSFERFKDGNYFLRAFFSLGEIDDTSKLAPKTRTFSEDFTLVIKAQKTR